TGLFNMIPVQPFDGYNLLERIITSFLSPEKIAAVLKWIEIVACVAAAPVIVVFFLDGWVNFSSVVFLFYLFVVDIMEKM
ncbi:MAG: hypothetical protein IJY73_01540, partial [Oscillospiraceae bacterium]|nr:hypothetical protein [Oscillospiraceae bacterium]